ncbi:hypothetical protein O3M35_008651 [Rhynocoris fuscipes]|uniref:SH3 domain-containing protein n=1 Tax=Rhynocoris fuscipes TaxID=488301 RepID=A0AAW1D8I9_9HEMI
MAEALVEFDYKAKEPDELTIKKGDIITDISFKPGGWWEGTLTRTGKRGMFPDNFVKLITDSEGEAVHHIQPPRRCRVLFHYKPANEDELELQVGDIIDVISEVEEGWWKGKLKNRIGVFPSNFVAEITEVKNETREASQRRHKLSRDDSTKQAISLSQEHISSTTHSSSHSSTTTHSQQIKTSTSTSSSEPPDLPMLPPKPIKEICRAMFHYEAANADELTLQEGDLITIITKEGQDPGWWKGELKGKIGVFPDNFVQIITSTSVEEAKPDRPSKTITTNKMRDHITKSATTSNMGSALTGVSRKFSEPTSKPPPSSVEEKNTHTHPSVSKKPVLPPPPMKKPQRSSSDLSKSPTSPALLYSKLGDNTASSGIQVTTSSTTRATSSVISSTMSQSTTSVETSSSAISSSGRWTVLHQESSGGTAANTASSNTATASADKINDKTDGLLWSKHRSYVVNSSSSSSSHVTETNSVIVNSTGLSESSSSTTGIGTQQPTNELDLDLVGRAAMLTHPTANRAKLPKRRPPSAVISKDVSLLTDSNFELSLDDFNDLKNGEEPSAAAAGSGNAINAADAESSPTALINGDADSHVVESVLAHSRANVSKMAPWVEELKLSQAKKSVQAGKTRVMIGGTSPTSDNISSPPSSNAESNTQATTKLQQQSLVTTTSVITNTTSATATATSIMSSSTSMMSSSLVGAVTLRSSSTAGGQRPQSMMGSLRSSLGSSEGLLSSTASGSASSNVSPQDTVTVTLRQWTELNDKLSRLELYFESQISTLTKTVEELTGKLDEEKQRRQVMQQELEKLTDLVTQV